LSLPTASDRLIIKAIAFGRFAAVQQSLFSRYEPNVEASMKSNLSPGRTFFDIGAQVGWFTRA
jgi:hypothetical protein